LVYDDGRPDAAADGPAVETRAAGLYQAVSADKGAGIDIPNGTLDDKGAGIDIPAGVLPVELDVEIGSRLLKEAGDEVARDAESTDGAGEPA
jgi:hypothetical protein